MNFQKYVLFVGLFFAMTMAAFAQKTYLTLQVPARNEYACLDTTGAYSVLPSGRRVTPAGEVVRIEHDPYGLAISPDGKTALTLHDGVITLIPTNAVKKATRIPSYDKTIKAVLEGSSFLGVAFSQDGKTAYLSGGDKGYIVVFDIATLTKKDTISLNGKVNGIKYDDSFTSDLLLNPIKNELLVLDRGNFRLVRIDLATKKPTASIKVGRQPFGIALTPDHKTALVAHVGLYEYPLVPGVTEKNRDTMALKFPPYGTFTKESEEGVELEDGRKIPGLGSPLVPEAMSVWTIDLATNKLKDVFKTGRQIGQFIEEAEIVGGASPNSIAVGRKYAYVSNATNDLISVIDLQKRKVVRDIPLHVDKRIDKYRGLMPFGLTLSADEQTLYVALLGLNAVAVVDVQKNRVRGLIPTGWGTSRVMLSPNGKKLFIISIRGLGAGPNGGQYFQEPPQGTYIGDIQLASFQAVNVPDSIQLAKYTQQVITNTFEEVAVTDDGKNPVPPLPGLRESPIKHIVYITKENRTYDEVFGQLAQGRGDLTLARYGVGVRVTDTILNADVMPNHSKIANTFAVSDNFYCDSDASIHGHHWMMGVIPNEWIEANSSTSGSQKIFSKAPGRRYPGATGAIDPEDYNEIGGLWEALERSKTSFYNFGEANEYTNVWEEWDHLEFGARQTVVMPLQKAVFNRTSHHYAGFNTNMPDQLRMDQFEKEFTEQWLTGKDTMPALIAIQIPNDHGADPRPDAGFPFVHSYMADNDLAIGRILQFLSHTPYWKNTLVIMTEDDPQGGVDHVDAHRSVLLMAGPYVKRGYASHTHGNFGSLLKVIYNTLNIPYVNQYDATASLLNDFFTDQPDFTPYDLVYPDLRVFDTKKAMDIYEKTFDWSNKMKSVPMDDPKDQREKHYKEKGKNE